MHARFASLATDPDSLDPSQFLKDIDSIGKGRMAQRLAAVLMKEDVHVCPEYIESALNYLKAKLG